MYSVSCDFFMYQFVQTYVWGLECSDVEQKFPEDNDKVKLEIVRNFSNRLNIIIVDDIAVYCNNKIWHKIQKINSYQVTVQSTGHTLTTLCPCSIVLVVLPY